MSLADARAEELAGLALGLAAVAGPARMLQQGFGPIFGTCSASASIMVLVDGDAVRGQLVLSRMAPWLPGKA